MRYAIRLGQQALSRTCTNEKPGHREPTRPPGASRGREILRVTDYSGP
jgi:hypothetical protein